MREPGSARDPLWYKDAIIYELHVKTFCDADGDGIGDFAGLTRKLDYLQHLGVTCLWLLPFYESPLRDDGYDIAHYERVHPQYGTLELIDGVAFPPMGPQPYLLTLAPKMCCWLKVAASAEPGFDYATSVSRRSRATLISSSFTT